MKRDLAAIAEVRGPDDFDASARLIEDLGIDSLGMMELIVLLEDKYRLSAEKQDLMVRDWKGVTVGELFDEFCRIIDSR